MIYALLMIEIDAEPGNVNADDVEAMANAGLPDNMTIIGSTIRETLDAEIAGAAS
jgi:hypothetical protein